MQATQPLQQWAVYMPITIFSIFFWLAFLKFLKMLMGKGTPKISTRPEDRRLRLSVLFEELVSPCIVAGFALICIQGIEWLVSFTRRAEVGLMISLAVLGFFIIPFAIDFYRMPPEEFVTSRAWLYGSKRQLSLSTARH